MDEELENIEPPEENWTRYPNCILDNIDKYEMAEFKVISLMVRKNLGYWTKDETRKPNKKFSLEYIMVKCKFKSKATANKAVQGLIKKGSVKQYKNGNKPAMYDIVWSPPSGTENEPLPVQKMNHSGTENEPLPVQKMNPVKETKSKTNHKKETKSNAGPDYKKFTDYHQEKYIELYQRKPDWSNAPRIMRDVKKLFSNSDEKSIYERFDEFVKICDEPRNKKPGAYWHLTISRFLEKFGELAPIPKETVPEWVKLCVEKFRSRTGQATPITAELVRAMENAAQSTEGGIKTISGAIEKFSGDQYWKTHGGWDLENMIKFRIGKYATVSRPQFPEVTTANFSMLRDFDWLQYGEKLFLEYCNENQRELYRAGSEPWLAVYHGRSKQVVDGS